MSAEIMVRMDPPLRGLFHNSDYDLLLVVDKEHFNKNQAALDSLRVGSDIKFKGFLKNLGKGVQELNYNSAYRKKDVNVYKVDE